MKGVPKKLWAAIGSTPSLIKRSLRAVRRSKGRIVTQLAMTIAVVAGTLGLAIYAVPHMGSGWATEAKDDKPSPAAKDDDALALPPGLDSAPGVPEGSKEDEDGPDADSDSDTGPESDTALHTWAQTMSGVDIPTRAVEAYGNAEVLLAEAKPSCNLTWTTIAGIGSVETNHGSTNNTSLGTDGKPKKPIRGPVLDGSGDDKAIKDTDGGEWDGDKKWDRAVGPLQFIPSTWERWGADGDDDGKQDPNDIDDVAVAAGYYLCADDRDLAQAVDWYAGVYSYNHVDSYVRSVYDRADGYGKASKPD